MWEFFLSPLLGTYKLKVFSSKGPAMEEHYTGVSSYKTIE